ATARFADENREGPFAEHLRFLFEGHKLDLAVTLGAPAAAFLHKHHSRIAPETPAIFVGVEQRLVPKPLASNETAVASEIGLCGSLKHILSVLPGTKSVAVVVGASPLEQFWVGQMRKTFEPFSDRVAFTYFNDLSFDEMLARSATLPPQSVIFYALL